MHLWLPRLCWGAYSAPQTPYLNLGERNDWKGKWKGNENGGEGKGKSRGREWKVKPCKQKFC